MVNWVIVAGDYGASYKATVEDLDLSDCTATIDVWLDDDLLIDGEDCSAVTYDGTDSYCYYTVADGDIPLAAIIEDRRTVYMVMIKFVKAGYKEHDLGFQWLVVPPPPVAEA